MPKEQETTVDARAAYIKERLAAESSCREEVRAVLEKYGCKFDVEVTLREGSISPKITVVSR